MKSTGAIAVYSPARVAAILVGVVLVVLAIGFGIGRIGHGGDSSSAGSVTSSNAYGQGYRKGQADARASLADKPAVTGKQASTSADSTAATKAAYRRGVATGKRSAPTKVFSAGSLGAGSFFVKIEGGKIGPHLALQEGRIYSLCRGGATICFQKGTLTPPGSSNASSR